MKTKKEAQNASFFVAGFFRILPFFTYYIIYFRNLSCPVKPCHTPPCPGSEVVLDLLSGKGGLGQV